jgi:hypothetical protein
MKVWKNGSMEVWKYSVPVSYFNFQTFKLLHFFPLPIAFTNFTNYL